MAKSGFAKEHLRALAARYEENQKLQAALRADYLNIMRDVWRAGFDGIIFHRAMRWKETSEKEPRKQAVELSKYLNALGLR